MDQHLWWYSYLDLLKINSTSVFHDLRIFSVEFLNLLNFIIASLNSIAYDLYEYLLHRPLYYVYP